MRVAFPIAASTSLCLLGGCASYETTYFVPDADGRIVPTVVAGVPIVVTVPQKLAFYATESRYLIETPIAKDGVLSGVAKSYSTETTVDKTPIQLGKSQLVNLDIKRPLSGTAVTSMELSAAQYPTKLASNVDDKTFSQALEAVQKIIEKQGVAISANAAKTLISQRNYLIVYDPDLRTISKVRV